MSPSTTAAILAAARRMLTVADRLSPVPKPVARRETPLVALVYRGPASLPGCPEAAVNLLRSSRRAFDIRYVGPDEDRPLSTRALADATLYVQPGGRDLDDAYRHMRRHRKAIRAFVNGGGRYLGFCLGGYLAGATPGFALLPGDTDQYISSRGATVDSEDDTLVRVMWRGQERILYFQDGPYFWTRPGTHATVIATYPNGTIAAMAARFGAGRVAVVGPHPEADETWYADADLDLGGQLGLDLGLDLLDEVLTP